jgi:uncharacterized protein YjbI with pentapeptide repeats
MYSDFDYSDSDNSDFDNSDFDNSDFDNSDFDNSDFDNSDFDNSDFDNSDFDNYDYRNSEFKRSYRARQSGIVVAVVTVDDGRMHAAGLVTLHAVQEQLGQVGLAQQVPVNLPEPILVKGAFVQDGFLRTDVKIFNFNFVKTMYWRKIGVFGSDPLCFSSSSALHFFLLFFSCPSSC